MRRCTLLALAGALVALTWAAAGIAKDYSQEPAIPSDLTTTSLLLDVTRAGKRLVAVGEWGHVILSDDGGKTWRQAQSVPTQMTLTEVTFVNSRQGWAVGHDAVVVHTSDGGEQWELQFADPEDEAVLLSVWFEDENHGIVVGQFGLMLETRDGGKNWERRPALAAEGEEPHLIHIFPGPEGALFIAAEYGTGFRSTDRGKTWQPLALPYEGSFWGGLALDGGAVLMIGMRGHAFRSEDLGETWEAVDTDTNQSLQDVKRLANGMIVIVGLGGTVTSSTDGGRTFTNKIERDRRGIASVAQGAGGALLLFGETGIKTRNK